jgi:hypothetical protein
VNGNAADAIRVVLVIIPGSLLFFSVLAVMTSYLFAFRRDRIIAKITGQRVYGLLPFHVAAVAVTVLAYDFVTLFDTFQRLDTSLTWRLPLYALANITGCASMAAVYRFERLRYNNAHP